MSKWFAFFIWEEWVIYFKRAAEIHGKHREPQNTWGFPHIFAKDSCRMHVLVIAALWNRITLNLGQTFYSDWNPTTRAIFFLKGMFMCTIFTSPNIYLHIQKQKVPVNTPLNNIFQSYPLQNRFLRYVFYLAESLVTLKMNYINFDAYGI